MKKRTGSKRDDSGYCSQVSLYLFFVYFAFIDAQQGPMIVGLKSLNKYSVMNWKGEQFTE